MTTDPAHPHPPPTPRQATLCLICGYHLRGLHSEGACPECNAPIRGSVNGDILRYASGGHLARLHAGAIVLLLAASLTVITDLIGGVLGAITREGHSMGGLIPAVLTGLWSILLLAMTVYGWWCLSDAEPMWSSQDHLQGLRRMLRIMVGLTAAAMATMACLRVLFSIRTEIDPLSGGTGDAIVMIGGSFATIGLLIITTFVVAAVFLRRFCTRINSEQVLREARRLIWLIPVVYGSLWLISVLVTITIPYNGSIVVLRLWSLAATVIHVIAYTIIWIGFLARLRRRLETLSRAAQGLPYDDRPD